MKQDAEVEVPGHISGFWYVYKREDPLHTGTVGAGLVIEPGLIVSSNPGYNEKLMFNGRVISVNTLESAYINAGIEGVPIKVSSPFELGRGYGASAAIALGGLYISFREKGILKSWLEIGRYAHQAEVENVTGYGDVIAEIYGGGLELRIEPGAPGIGVVDRVPVSSDINVLTVGLDRYTTLDMFKRYGDKIRESGIKVYKEFIKAPSIESFLHLSHRFSMETGMLTKEMDTRLKELLGGYIRQGRVLGYFVKKGLLVVVSEGNASAEVYRAISTLGTPKVFRLNFSGCRVI
jgi:pantoate kinase